jgi:cytochrome o ubiquinol oxidase operon protein cyoD
MDHTEKRRSDFSQYAAGFIFSIVLTLSSYYLVATRALPSAYLIVFILIFGLVQMGVQLLFFLHLDSEKKPHWNLILFATTFFLIITVIGASFWIMHHLNYNMTPTQMNNVIFHEEGIYK